MTNEDSFATRDVLLATLAIVALVLAAALYQGVAYERPQTGGGPAAPLRPTPALTVPGLEDVTTLRQSAPQLEVGRDGNVTITYVLNEGDDNRVCVACMPYAQP
jgi:hypothetical protein